MLPIERLFSETFEIYSQVSMLPFKWYKEQVFEGKAIKEAQRLVKGNLGVVRALLGKSLQNENKQNRQSIKKKKRRMRWDDEIQKNTHTQTPHFPPYTCT